MGNLNTKSTYSISELGAAFGLSRSTLLYYDRVGLLSPRSRTGSGYRRYGKNEYEKLRAICRYRGLGVPLKAIRHALAAGRKSSVKVLRARLDEVEQQIADLENHRRILAGMLRRVVSESPSVKVDKALWVEMLRVAGMDDDAMHRWHVEFERRAPAGHESFLVSLGIQGEEIEKIRQWSRESNP